MLQTVLLLRRPGVQQTLFAVIGGILFGAFFVLKPTATQKVVARATVSPSVLEGVKRDAAQTVTHAPVKHVKHNASRSSNRMGPLVREEIAFISPPPLPSHLSEEWMEAHRADVGAGGGNCIEQNSARKGDEVDDPTREKSAEACQARCKCIEGCSFFTYWPDGHCHVQKDTSTPFSAVGAVSGPGFCEDPGEADGQEEPSELPQVEIQPIPAGPLLYVYELPERFRNGGKDPTCWTDDCVFGGPPEIVHGVEIWSSNQFHMPRMVYHRFLKSPRRTRKAEEAEVFLVPAYSSKPSDETKCAENQDLFDTLFKLNPLLKQKAWATEKGPRHLFIDARGWENCNYMWEMTQPFRLFHRINIELNGMLPTGPEDWTDGKPFFWYQFPYPAVYHGPPDATPAKLRNRGLAKYLWSFSGTGRGVAGYLRQCLMKQCTKCEGCFRQTKLREVTGEVHEFTMRDVNAGKSSYAELSEMKMASTFCVEPPGDTITRKSLIDSMVLGCIPVIFEHQEFDMFEAFFSAAEFAAAVVYVPEVRLVGKKGTLSAFGKGPAGRKKKMYQALYPSEAQVLEALDAPEEAEREEKLKQLYPKAEKMSQILGRIPVAEIRRKQEALAEIAPRIVLSLDDSGRDALRILLDRIISEDKAAHKRSKESRF